MAGLHVALMCPDLTGHLNPMTTLGRALARRGHRVSLVGLPVSAVRAQRAGLAFLPIGEAEHASGTLAAARARLGQLQGLAALQFTGKMLCQSAAITLRDAPGVLRDAAVDAVLVDQVSAGASVAEAMGLPMGVICNALALHQEPAVPPPVLGWAPRSGWLGRCRNRLGNQMLRWAARPVMAQINSYRRLHGLTPVSMGDNEQYGLIQVAQQPAFFDFPRQLLPDHFHYTGPWHEAGRDDHVSFPWERLDGRPMIYASLGTLQNRVLSLFAAIAQACMGIEAQLVMSLGRADAHLDCALPDGAIVVSYAPQLELLQKSTAIITHAGLNTALEALACGLPMVAIPLTNDQPGVARRLAWLGAAELVPPRHATPQRLGAAIVRVMQDPAYRAAAQRWKEQLQRCPGVEQAATLVEYALSSNRCLTRQDAGRLGLVTDAPAVSCT